MLISVLCRTTLGNICPVAWAPLPSRPPRLASWAAGTALVLVGRTVVPFAAASGSGAVLCVTLDGLVESEPCGWKSLTLVVDVGFVLVDGSAAEMCRASCCDWWCWYACSPRTPAPTPAPAAAVVPIQSPYMLLWRDPSVWAGRRSERAEDDGSSEVAGRDVSSGCTWFVGAEDCIGRTKVCVGTTGDFRASDG